MSLTYSTMLPLGTRVPEFSLPDVISGKRVSPDNFAEKKALLFMFISRHCPYVKHIQKEIARVGSDYASKDVGFIAITSNDAETYPEDSPESSAELAAELGFTFPFCYDESQEVAKAFNAACTPEFYIFDNARKLVYRGQLDDSRHGNETRTTGRDVRSALDAVISGNQVNLNQIPNVGCSIKWKAGNEPAHFGVHE